MDLAGRFEEGWPFQERRLKMDDHDWEYMALEEDLDDWQDFLDSQILEADSIKPIESPRVSETLTPGY